MGFVDFDSFGMAEMPVITLAYPQGTELGQLGAYEDLKYDFALNSYSTITFKYPYYGADKEKANLYDDIETYMLLKVGTLGEFIIANCKETNDGAERYLEIDANSAEMELCRRKINVFDGTYKFYDAVNPDGTLLGELIKYLPTWSIGEVSTELWTKYRTFEVPDSTLYDFLMNDVSETYECIFVFDTINKIINAYTTDDIVKDSDIYVGYANFLKASNVEAVTDNLTTVMSCYGGDNNGAGNVNIASVNPLGTVYLYNFGHFKHMMSDHLKASLTTWEARYAAQKASYTTLLAQLKTYKTNYVTASAELVDAQTALTAAEDVQAAMIAGGQTTSSEYQNVLARIATANTRIATAKSSLASIETQMRNIQTQQTTINNSLKFDTSAGIFSAADLLELEHFKLESTHQDDNFIVTDVMTIDEQQDMVQQLYDQCERLMVMASYPTYNITADSVNFLFIKELAPYLDTLYDATKPETYKQLLATKFHLEVAPDEWIDPVLLKCHVNFSNPTDFSMEFSNKYRLNDVMWTYSDLIGEAVHTSGNISFDYTSLKNWEGERNELIDFANGALDATKNKLVNNTATQSFLVDGTGMRARNSEDQRGIWLTSDTLAFSDDNFSTVKTAIGLIDINGTLTYGVNAETLIGKAIFGANLTITNAGNTMTMDGNGLNVTSAHNTISLNPTDGILIKKGTTDIFKFDNSTGDLIVTGKVTATSGAIGGFNVTSNSISSSNGNINLKSDGTGKIGMITIGTSSTTFDGNIYAKNIQYGGDYGTLSGSAITGGSITAYEIAGGTITDAELKDGAVTSGKIGNGAVTSGKIGEGAVVNGKIATDAVGTSQIQNGSIYKVQTVQSVQDTLTQVGTNTSNISGINTKIGNFYGSQAGNTYLAAYLGDFTNVETTQINGSSIGWYTTGGYTYLVRV